MLTHVKQYTLAAVRRLQSYWILRLAGRRVSAGVDFHIGRRTRIWAPHHARFGSHVYIGKEVHIEANCTVGDYCLIANRVAFVGRNDHDYRAIGFPVRYSPWIGSERFSNRYTKSEVTVESDVWIGYGAVLLTGVKIGKGALVAAGSVVTRDVEPYSIVAGNPSKVVGYRFADTTERSLHEDLIAHGRFALSERGYDHCVIEIGNPASGEGQ